MLQHPWFCFICNPKSIAANMPIKFRKNWRYTENLVFNQHSNSDIQIPLKPPSVKPKLSVFAPFDGLSTSIFCYYIKLKNFLSFYSWSTKYILFFLALVVLKKLNFQPLYYASEIDDKAKSVSFKNHGKDVIQLGDITKLKSKDLEPILPINLFIGGAVYIVTKMINILQ